MKEYSVSYLLGNMYHSYVVSAENECRAIEKVVSRIPDTSKDCFHDFKIERYHQPWN